MPKQSRWQSSRGQGDLAIKQDINLLKSEINQLKTDNAWIKWVVGANLALSIAIVSVIIVL